MMTWKIKEIWLDYTYEKGKYKGQTYRAFPLWNEVRGGYDTYPAGAESSNVLDDAELAKSLEELYEHLSQDRSVRCVVHETNYKSVLGGKFQAVFQRI